MTSAASGALRVAVLGCADVAWRRMLPALTAADGVNVVAVASRALTRARQFAERFGAAAIAGYAALVDREDVDAVYIPLPPALRGEWIERALRSGKHVLAEKPLTTSGRETADLFRLARARGLVLMENFPFLFHAQHRAVGTLVADGAIGEARHFASAFTFPPRPPGDIRYRPDLGGGALLDASVYPIRAALRLLDGDLRLAGAVVRHDDRFGVDVSGTILAALRSGVTAVLSFGMEHAYQARYEICGSLGCLRLDHAFTVSPTHRPLLRLERDGTVREIDVPPDDQIAKLIAAFAAAVADGGSPRAYELESIRQAQLVDEARSTAERFDRVLC